MKNWLKTIRKLNNKGLSLVELICAMGIMALVGSTVAGVMVVSANSYSRGSVEVELQQESQLLANQVENLIQNAVSATVSGDVLTIEKMQGDVLVTYDVTFDAANKCVYLSYNGTQQTLAKNVNAFFVNVSDFDKSGRIIMDIGIEKNTRMYVGSYTATSRNADVEAVIGESTVKINCNTKLLLEPLCTGLVQISITGASVDGVNWELMGANDTTGTKVYREDDPSKNSLITSTTDSDFKLVVEIGRNETASDLKLLIRSNQRKEDGLTPAAQQVVDIKVRRVTGYDVGGTKSSGTDLRNGAKYTVTSKVFGNNLDLQTDFENSSEYITPYLIKWGLSYSKDGVEQDFRYNASSKTFYNDYIEVKINGSSTAVPTDLSRNPISNNAVVSLFLLETTNDTTFTVRLKSDISTGRTFQMLGYVMHTVGYNKSTQCYFGDATLGEENYFGYFRLRGKSALEFTSAIDRGSDENWGQFDWGYLKQTLEAKWGVNQGNFYCERVWRYRPVYSVNEAGEPVSVGNYSNWMISSSEYGNSINLRKESLILDSNTRYQIDIKWQICYNQGGVKKIAWPYDGVPKSEYYIEGAMCQPFTVALRPEGSSLAGIGSQNIELDPGSKYSMSFDSMAGIYRNYVHLGNNTGFKVQRHVYDAATDTWSWVDADNSLSDYYLNVRADNQKSEFDITLNRKGEYRVLLLRKKISTGHYNFNNNQWVYYEVTYDDSNNALYDEDSGRGIFYFSIPESTDGWKWNFANSYVTSGWQFNWANVTLDYNSTTGAFVGNMPGTGYPGFSKTVTPSYTYEMACNDFANNAKQFIHDHADQIANP